MMKPTTVKRAFAATAITAAAIMATAPQASASTTYTEVYGNASLSRPCSGRIVDQGAYGGGWWTLYYNSTSGGTNCLIFRNTAGGTHKMWAELDRWVNGAPTDWADDEGIYSSYAGPATVWGTAHTCVRVELHYDSYDPFSKVTACG